MELHFESDVIRHGRVAADPVGEFAEQGIVGQIVTCLIAAVLGVFAGIILTVSHQATVQVGDAVVPWGIITAIILTGMLLAGLRLVFGTRVVPAAAAVGLLAAATLLALPSAGGSILVPDTVTGYIWTFSPVIITSLVLAWPRLPQKIDG
jgi:N-acetyl-1-D-myo-inositol-2-amino-2-deoxy-alpha-D-glucopyranoside deacetylase